MVQRKSGLFSIIEDNKAIFGATISSKIYDEKDLSIYVFSLGKGTDISAEKYDSKKFIYVLNGSGNITEINKSINVGDAILLPGNSSYGIVANEDFIYIDIFFGKEIIMNEMIKPGEIFRLADIIPYRDGGIVNTDIFKNDKMKLAVMSFTEGTSLPEHSAPGNAIVFALEGEGIIGYEGKEYRIKSGENFSFAKGGKHYVKADGNFKMALLVVFE